MKPILKPILAFIVLLVSTGLWSSCAQESELSSNELVFEKVINSQSFKDYYTDFKKRRRLLNQYALFDTKAVYASKAEKLEAIDESVRNANEKARIFGEISTLRNRKSFPSSNKKEALAETISFIQEQKVDSRIKENLIEYFKYNEINKKKTFVEDVLEDFPSMTNENLVEILKKYDALQMSN